jgi:hypothetical protein
VRLLTVPVQILGIKRYSQEFLDVEDGRADVHSTFATIDIDKISSYTKTKQGTIINFGLDSVACTLQTEKFELILKGLNVIILDWRERLKR